MIATTLTTVAVAGLGDVNAHDKVKVPTPISRKAKGWLDHLPILACRPNGTEVKPEQMRVIHYVYGDIFTIAEVNRMETDSDGEYVAGVRVFFTALPTEEDIAEMNKEVFIGTGKYKGAISRKV